MTESRDDGVRQDPAGDRPLTSDEPEGEDVETAQEAEDLEQDPDSVPNRVQEPEPPKPERVGPWDDEDVED
jgi:hypothetical protein